MRAPTTLVCLSASLALLTAGCGGHSSSKRPAASTAAPATSGTTGGTTGTPGGTPAGGGSTTPGTTPGTAPAPAQVVAGLIPDADLGKDTYVRSDGDFVNDNFGVESEMLVGDTGAGAGGGDLRTFVEYRAAVLPPGAILRRATLSLYVVGSRFADEDVTIRVQPVVPTQNKQGQGKHQTAWREGSSTTDGALDGLVWDGDYAQGVGITQKSARAEFTQPNVDTSTDFGRGANGVVAELVIAKGTANTRVDLDVTAVALLWANGTLENNGLCLSHAGEGAPFLDGAKVFASSDVADQSRRPVFTFEYDLPPSADAYALVQPGSLDGQDTWVRNEGLYTNDNTGAWADLAVGSRTWSQLGDRRSYVQFDLSTLPAGATIVSATLELYHASTNDGFGATYADNDVTVRAYRVIDTQNKNGMGAAQTPWVEGTSTFDAALDGIAWDAAPATGSFPTSSSNKPEYTQPDVDTTTNYGQGANGIVDEVTVTGGTRERWYAFDVTRVAQDWASGAAPNHGLRLAHATEGAPYDEGSKHFFSSDTLQAPNHRPRLRIVYR